MCWVFREGGSGYEIGYYINDKFYVAYCVGTLKQARREINFLNGGEYGRGD